MIAAVQGFVPNLIKEENSLTELTLTLPFESRANNMFTRLFRFLDDNMKTLYLSSYGLRDTTLEQIFLRVTAKHSRGETGTGGHKSLTLAGNQSSTSYKQQQTHRKADKAPTVKKIDGTWKHRWMQFKYLFLRRWHNSRRSGRGILTQIVLPPAFVLLALSMQYISILPAEPPALVLDPKMYENEILQHPNIYSFYANEKAFPENITDEHKYNLKDWQNFYPRYVKNGETNTYTCDRKK